MDGNGGMGLSLITIYNYYGSFPHSLSFAPVRFTGTTLASFPCKICVSNFSWLLGLQHWWRSLIVPSFSTKGLGQLKSLLPTLCQGSGLLAGRSNLSKHRRTTKIGQGLWLQPSTADDRWRSIPKELLQSLTHRVCEVVQPSGLLLLFHGLPRCAPSRAFGETLTSACESWTRNACC